MLFVVATPIGNLAELTHRAQSTLASVDVIYCEDTRRTAVLLGHYDIKKPMVTLNKDNEHSRIATILAELEAGRDVALVSDAGMPLVSDPGSQLVRAVLDAGQSLTVISGPCACINALVLSGLDTRQFCMLGFLPTRRRDRDALLDQVSALAMTLVLYVAPHDLDSTLDYLAQRLGPRNATLVREISKMHEQVTPFVLGSPCEAPRRGEMVLVISGATPADIWAQMTIAEHLRQCLQTQPDPRIAVKTVAAARGVPKSTVYAVMEALKRDPDLP